MHRLSAQELVDDIDSNYQEEKVDNIEVEKEVEKELFNSIYQELSVPFEERDIYWAQTLLNSV